MTGYDIKGKPQRARGYSKTKTEAAEKAQSIAADRRRGAFVPVGKDSTVAEFLDHWLDDRIRPHREPKTTEFYEGNIRRHLKPVLGHLPLRKLTVQHVQWLINDRTESGFSPITIHAIMRTLRSALKIACREALIPQNVAEHVTMPKLVQRDPEFLSPQEAKSLIAASRGHFLENLIAFALSTGVRMGEACGLTWADVNFDRQQITISQQLQRIEGKLKLKGLKSRSSKRTLAMSDIILTALRDERTRQMMMRSEVGEGLNPLDLVFLNAEYRPLDPKNVNDHLAALCRKAGVRVISFHKLRHTAATLLVNAGVELHQVKEILGHSQIALTANLYAHGVTEAQRKAVNILDRVLQSGELPE